MIAYYTPDLNPIEIGNLWMKVQVTVTQYSFFLHYSLLTSLMWFSFMFDQNEIQYAPYALGIIDLNYMKIEWEMVSF